MNTYKITIVSPSNSWFSPYVQDIADFCQKNGHIFTLVNHHKDVVDQDIVFYLSYTNIVSKDTLSHNKHNIVVHASDLPKGKGWSPFVWSILNGDNDIVLSLFEANEKVDDGDIYIKSHVLLDGYELIDDIRLKIGSAIVKICCDFIEDKDNYVKNKKAQDVWGGKYLF